jgi:hypothetical protein
VKGQYQTLGFGKLIRIDRLVNQSCGYRTESVPTVRLLGNAILNLNLLGRRIANQAKRIASRNENVLEISVAHD